MMNADLNTRVMNEQYEEIEGFESENKTYWFELCNAKGRYHRFLALSFMCMLGFGTYFCYDNPSALQDHVLKDIDISTTQFSLLYSLYSWPSMVVCVVGGILIDSVFGIRFGTIMYISISLIGQLIVAAGAVSNQFWIMALGRFVFGLGAEPLAIAQTNYAVAWFKDKELSMVFGFQQSCSDAGSFLNFWVMDPLYNEMSDFYTGHKLLGIVLFIASITCIFSIVAAIVLCRLHLKANRVLKRNAEITRNVITIKDVKKFRGTFWLLIVVGVGYYVAIYPFFALSQAYFMEKYDMNTTDANRLSSMLNFVSIVGGPVLGFIIDKVGRNIFWLMAAIACSTLGHSILAFLPWSPYIGVVLISIATPVVTSAYYPLIPLLIPHHQLGTAYGLCASFQNFIMGVATFVAGMIVDNLGYIWLEVQFITSLLVSFIAAIAVVKVDAKQDGLLNMSSYQRKEITI